MWLLPDGRVAVKLHGFMPSEGAARHEHTDRVPYTAWAKSGYVTLTPGAVTENAFVDEWIAAGEKQHGWKVIQTGYDGHNATDLAIAMNQRRSNEDFCVEIVQSCSGQNLAVKGFRDLLVQGKLVIEESPLAMWCLANAVEVTNGNGDSRLSKKHKDDSERIDPLAAAMNALTLALLRRENPTLADRIRQGGWTMWGEGAMRRKDWPAVALLAAGLLAVAAGVAMIYLPAGVITLGAALTALGVLAAIGGTEGGGGNG